MGLVGRYAIDSSYTASIRLLLCMQSLYLTNQDQRRWESWVPPGGDSEHRVRVLLRAVMGLHSTWSGEIWLWRGQSRGDYRLEPGMHSRVRVTMPKLALSEDNVKWATTELIRAARANRLDRIEGLQLPDLALLAHLQHHGAGTPLLDVTVDPFVGLWMVAHASADDPTSDDDRDGALFAIRRPEEEERWLASLDSRPYWSLDGADIVDALMEGIHWYRPPDISERLRIQRGSFLIGPLANTGQVTFPLNWEPKYPGKGWLGRRIKRLGLPGQPTAATTDVVVFRVPAGLKRALRTWLNDRAGLTQSVIYPTPWHRPFLEEFCRGYGRRRSIDF
jgi:hypothetical protein